MAVSLVSRHSTKPGATSTGKYNLIAAHGLLGNSNNFNSFVTRLLRKEGKLTDVYQVDLRNHGASPHTSTHHVIDLASDLEAFALNIPGAQTVTSSSSTPPRTILLGHSMGGMAAMHSVFRRTNFNYYHSLKGGNDNAAAIGAALRKVEHQVAPVEGASPTPRPFYSGTNKRAVVCGVVVEDIVPVLPKDARRLSSVTSVLDTISTVPLGELRDRETASKRLDEAGMKNAMLRSFVLTNFIPGNPSRWRCNMDVLCRDHDNITFPDPDPATLPGGKLRRVGPADVPVHLVPGTRSPFYVSRERVESDMGVFFDSPQMTEIDSDHNIHFEKTDAFVDVVHKFIEECFERADS